MYFSVKNHSISIPISHIVSTTGTDRRWKLQAIRTFSFSRHDFLENLIHTSKK